MSKGERTRERLLGAAVGEFRRAGVAAADVRAIAAAAGVSPATFYFHFPTRDHVLVELERREEERIAAELTRFFAESPSLPEALSQTVVVIQALEQRLGSFLFKDFLALHFSAARPPEEVWAKHPVIVVVVEHLRLAHDGARFRQTWHRSIADCSSWSGSMLCCSRCLRVDRCATRCSTSTS